MVNVVIAKNFNLVDEDIQAQMLQVASLYTQTVMAILICSLVDADPEASDRSWYPGGTHRLPICACCGV